MSDSNITKLAFANSLKALMAKKPFDKISVGDIADNCALTRQTFYYHFQDKYDLMNWIYFTETMRFISSYDTLEHWTEGLVRLCRYMRENKTFYINALGTTGANSFPEYLRSYILNITRTAVESALKKPFDPERWGFFIEFFATAFVGYIVRWSAGGMKADPAEFIQKIRSLYDGSVLAALENMEKTADP